MIGCRRTWRWQLSINKQPARSSQLSEPFLPSATPRVQMLLSGVWLTWSEDDEIERMCSQVEKQRIAIVMIISVYVIWREEEEESSRRFVDLIRNFSSLCLSQQSPMAAPVTHRYFLNCSCRLTRGGQVQPWGWDWRVRLRYWVRWMHSACMAQRGGNSAR